MDTIASLTKIADDAADTGMSEEEAASITPLEGKKKAVIEELFAIWDACDGCADGGISLDQLVGQGIEVGPNKEKVFTQFKAMDTDGDNVVSLEEMMTYFSIAATMMSEDEFAATVEEMKESAKNDKSVADMVAVSKA